MTTSLAELLRESFAFLDPYGKEFRRLMGDLEPLLPAPYPIFLEDERASPFHGFPVLLSPGLAALREGLTAYLDAEEEAQVAAILRQPFSRTDYGRAWERYRSLLVRAVENSALASYGRHFAAVFWLVHSLDVARRLRESPKRLLRFDAELGRRHGDVMKYRVFEKYRENVLGTVHESLRKLTLDKEEVEEEALPQLLKQMFDNILIFTEEHVSLDLVELTSFLNGHLRVDGRDLRKRFDLLISWHEEELARDRNLSALLEYVLGVEPRHAARRLLNRAGYVRYLSTRKGYNPNRLLSLEEVELWERLLVRIKIFEVFSALRQTVLPVRWEEDRLVFRAGGLDRTWVGQRLIHLSSATRPLDFLTPGVIDPRVHRYGLIYDISDFSTVVSMLRRAGSQSQEDAFRLMFRFQRRINDLAASHRLQLEKYLGDGAFFTSREPLRTLLCGIYLQRIYRRAVAEGLPFDRGMRIGLNFGHYRLIPIRNRDGEGEHYEFFGHGVVELTRLTSGKSRQEVEEMRSVLISYGYPQSTVERFFEPLSGRNLDVIDKDEEARPSYAYINRNGSLINEGIVATEEFMAQLSATIALPRLYEGRQGSRTYLVLALDEEEGRVYVGLRKLGVANLKGLEELPLYEVLDGADLDEGELPPIEGGSLLGALERLASVDRGPGRGPSTASLSEASR